MTGEKGIKFNWRDVAPVEGLRKDEGWIDMRVQFGVTTETTGAQNVVFGRTVFRPGSRHDAHRHVNAEEVQYIVAGEGLVIDGDDEIPVREGDVFFTPKGRWHGFINTSETEDAVLIWLWAGAGSRDAAGYEARSADEA